MKYDIEQNKFPSLPKKLIFILIFVVQGGILVKHEITQICYRNESSNYN